MNGRILFSEKKQNSFTKTLVFAYIKRKKNILKLSALTDIKKKKKTNTCRS